MAGVRQCLDRVLTMALFFWPFFRWGIRYTPKVMEEKMTRQTCEFGVFFRGVPCQTKPRHEPHQAHIQESYLSLRPCVSLYMIYLLPVNRFESFVNLSTSHKGTSIVSTISKAVQQDLLELIWSPLEKFQSSRSNFGESVFTLRHVHVN